MNGYGLDLFGGIAIWLLLVGLFLFGYVLGYTKGNLSGQTEILQLLIDTEKQNRENGGKSDMEDDCK